MSTSVSDYYQPGEVIYDGKPFVRVIRRDLWDVVCANCLVRNIPLKKCGACGLMKYCGKICQRNAWNEHKLECQFLLKYTDQRSQPLVQIVGNILLKINGRDWKTVTERIMDKEVSFDDLISHSNQPNHLNLDIRCQSIEEPLRAYVGDEYIPSKKKLLELIGKVIYNQFGFDGVDSSPETWALFLGVSKFDHSCVPNSALRYNGKTLAVRATQTIHKKLGMVTISYWPLVTNLESTAFCMSMKKTFFGDCYCMDCSQPFGESTLTKILDMSNAQCVIEETEATLRLVSLLTRLKYPIGIVTRAKLKQLLQKQMGVLGVTNKLHMRTLAIKCLFMDGPKEELRTELMELADSMKEAFGENYIELIRVYEKLVEVNKKLDNVLEVVSYIKKILQLNSVCYGPDEIPSGIAVFVKLFSSFL